MAQNRRPKRKRGSWTRWYYVGVVGGVFVVAAAAYLMFASAPGQGPSKPIILYVNQGNGIVNGSNFRVMVDYATSRGFNTVFFQVYRQGLLLFTPAQLGAFVNESHAGSLKIFFAFYITNSSQKLPASIYNLGEDGISLDMSALSTGAQEALLASLRAAYSGETAVTTTDMSSPLTPGLLVLETYGSSSQQYIRHGTVASVGVFATSSEQDYRSQFQYAIQNSDGVMVFDYAGLLKRGY